MMRFPWRRRLQVEPADPQAKEPAAVLGERHRFVASGARSLQSRMTTLLAAGLMTSVGAGMLAWYYAVALSRPTAARTAVRGSLPQLPGEGMSLPTFGDITQPNIPGASPLAARVRLVPSIAALASSGGQSSVEVPIPPSLLIEPPLDRAAGGPAHSYGRSSQVPMRQQVLDRRLSGDVFASGMSGISSNITGQGPAPNFFVSSQQSQVAANEPHPDALQTLLAPAVLGATRAQLVPTQRLLLPKGAFIDCTLETAIDSTLPGMTTCITATDTFGTDGMVVLLERGTKLIGETRGEVSQGQARVFIVWTEARTPSGVVVRLDSPGTDALGRSGLDGAVNRHFWQRFGAAALISTIDGVVQAEVQSSSHSGTVVLDPTASESVLTDTLRSTVNIPPTIRVRNGARIQVLVARDLDFRPVYELEPR